MSTFVYDKFMTLLKIKLFHERYTIVQVTRVLSAKIREDVVYFYRVIEIITLISKSNLEFFHGSQINFNFRSGSTKKIISVLFPCQRMVICKPAINIKPAINMKLHTISLRMINMIWTIEIGRSFISLDNMKVHGPSWILNIMIF